MAIDYDKLKNMQIEPVRHTYTRRDTMLYALGLGVGARNPIDPGDLKYIYEKSLVALPTQAVTLAAEPQGIGAVIRQRWETLAPIKPTQGLCWVAVEAVQIVRDRIAPPRFARVARRQVHQIALRDAERGRRERVDANGAARPRGRDRVAGDGDGGADERGDA